jgi:hypothetical protein
MAKNKTIQKLEDSLVQSRRVTSSLSIHSFIPIAYLSICFFYLPSAVIAPPSLTDGSCQQQYAETIRLYEEKLREHSIPVEELGFTPVRSF